MFYCPLIFYAKPPEAKSIKRFLCLFHRGQMWGVLWFPFVGGLGAFIVESYVTITKPELIRGTKTRFSGTGIRYKLKFILGIFTGFVLAYALQPSDITQAFLIGVGWEAVLSSVIKDANIVSVMDKRVLRTLKRKDLLKLEDTLQKAKEKIQDAGTLDRILVVDGNKRLMGLVTDGMIKRAIDEEGVDPSQKMIKEIMIGATNVVKVDVHDSVAKAIKVAEQQCPKEKIEGVTVIDHEGRVKGLLSLDQLKTLDRPLFSK